MRKLHVASLFLLFGTACTASTSGSDSDGTDSDSPSGGEPMSSYTAGKYQLNSFVLLDQDVGGDVDGDGTEDNNLPQLLDLAEMMMSDQPLAPEELNASIATNLEEGLLVILLDALQTNADLTVDVLGGSTDDQGVLTVDPLSYDDSGNPTSHMQGAFASETEFSVSAPSIDVPVTFEPDSEPILVPFELAQLEGTLTLDASSGILYGAIPGEAMVYDVIEPLVPDDQTDPMTEEEILDLCLGLLENENLTDIVLEDGSRAVSASFSFEAIPATF